MVLDLYYEQLGTSSVFLHLQTPQNSCHQLLASQNLLINRLQFHSVQALRQLAILMRLLDYDQLLLLHIKEIAVSIFLLR